MHEQELLVFKGEKPNLDIRMLCLEPIVTLESFQLYDTCALYYLKMIFKRRNEINEKYSS
jgi:hypothetical protein